jgi:hypothetical protein
MAQHHSARREDEDDRADPDKDAALFSESIGVGFITG